MMKNINFVSQFKKANIISIILFILSLLLVSFKGLNYGIDFKGGTLIELRTEKSIKASSIRDTLSSMNLGDVNVKKFGKDGDYLIKVEQKESNNNELIPQIKKKLNQDETNYSVEIGSCGIDFPLKLVRQFKKNMFRKIEIIDLEGFKHIGTLTKVSNTSFEINWNENTKV